ncbi:MAG: thioredoxin family protein [Tissierellia bacterium]|nr:thioredoxin family protein [Tissierellia bacterium]
MKFVELKSQEMLEELKKEGKYLLYFKTSTCNVCDVMQEKIKEKFEDIDLSMGLVQIETMPALRGQYLVFSGPTLLVFDGEKEIHRESRFIELDRLERVLDLWLS